MVFISFVVRINKVRQQYWYNNRSDTTQNTVSFENLSFSFYFLQKALLQYTKNNSLLQSLYKPHRKLAWPVLSTVWQIYQTMYIYSI